jgi:hypothetical protein
MVGIVLGLLKLEQQFPFLVGQLDALLPFFTGLFKPVFEGFIPLDSIQHLDTLRVFFAF